MPPAGHLLRYNPSPHTRPWQYSQWRQGSWVFKARGRTSTDDVLPSAIAPAATTPSPAVAPARSSVRLSRNSAMTHALT